LFGLGCLVASPTLLVATQPTDLVPDEAPDDPLLNELNVGTQSIDAESQANGSAGAHPESKATPIPLPAPLWVGLAGLGVSAAATRRKRRRRAL
jgi:hypothetical protein